MIKGISVEIKSLDSPHLFAAEKHRIYKQTIWGKSIGKWCQKQQSLAMKKKITPAFSPQMQNTKDSEIAV